MERVYQAGSLQEAYLIAGLLERQGIAVRILNENAQGAVGEIPFTHTYPELWVLDDHLVARARQILTAYESDHSSDANEVVCLACGESNPANFDLCWACGKPL